MDVYIFQAAIYCKHCGEGIKHDRHEYEGAEDSDAYPQGPYSNGGGEADCPQHCDSCGLFLENDLTPDGSAYTKQRWEEYMNNGRGSLAVLHDWRLGYPNEFAEWCSDAEEREEANTLSNGQLARLSELADS